MCVYVLLRKWLFKKIFNCCILNPVVISAEKSPESENYVYVNRKQVKHDWFDSAEAVTLRIMVRQCEGAIEFQPDQFVLNFRTRFGVFLTFG